MLFWPVDNGGDLDCKKKKVGLCVSSDTYLGEWIELCRNKHSRRLEFKI